MPWGMRCSHTQSPPTRQALSTFPKDIASLDLHTSPEPPCAGKRQAACL